MEKRAWKILYRGKWTSTIGDYEGVQTSDFAAALYRRRHPELDPDFIHAEPY